MLQVAFPNPPSFIQCRDTLSDERYTAPPMLGACLISPLALYIVLIFEAVGWISK